MTQYTIPAKNYAALKTKIEELNKKALKLKCPVIRFEKLATIRNVNTCTQEISIEYTIECSGESPIINGYELIAVIEHLSNEGNIVRSLPDNGLTDGALTAYRTAKNICEHCGYVRKRNNTYLVRHETGSIKQVGNSCLADYLGHADVKSLLDNASILIDALEACEEATDDDMDSHGGEKWVSLENYLAYVAMISRMHGYTSGAKAREEIGLSPTSIIAWIALLKKDGLEEISKDDRELVTRALEWIRDEARDLTSDYLYNLSIVCKGAMVTHRHIGIAASLIASYKRDTEKRLLSKKSRAESKHVHAVKDKVKNLTLTCTLLKPLESQYGVTYLTKFIDDTGNVYVWFSSSVELKQGKKYMLSGTVKANDIYEGAKQTILTRCKCEEIAPF